ncbi:MAG: hypothetical protein M1823_004853 [Watsoniomyces obsoletus]|nr:MAG: hypothetical protein M1823_004853 [Watsoniomyces obsoletus]
MSKFTDYTVIGDILFSVALITTLLRIYVRGFVIKNFGYDDYLIVVAMILGIPSLVIYNQWLKNISEANEYQPFFKAPKRVFDYFLLRSYVHSILYAVQIGLIKLSLLAFYHRLVPDRRYRIVIMVTAGVICIMTILSVFLWAFQCQPISQAWTRTAVARCRFLNTDINLMTVVFNLTTDVILLVMPFWVLFQLHTSTRRKVGLAMVFLVGTVATAASVVRLWKLVEVKQTQYQNNGNRILFKYADSLFASQIERYLALLCANAPAIFGLIKTMRQRRQSTRLSKYVGPSGYPVELGHTGASKTSKSATRQPTISEEHLQLSSKKDAYDMA